MAESDRQERTEQATPKRLDEARKQRPDSALAAI